MGAHDEFIQYETDDREKVKKLWQTDSEQARSEYGHNPYSGTIATMRGGIVFRTERFNNRDEAESFILDRHDKWSGPLAVLVRLPGKPARNNAKKAATAREAYAKASKALDALSRDAADSIRQRKSSTIGCGTCKSRLTVSYVHGTTCPVCRSSLLSPTFQKRIAAAKGRLEKASKALTAADTPPPSNKFGWLVGGWAAC